jgi:hypothetical protein
MKRAHLKHTHSHFFTSSKDAPQGAAPFSSADAIQVNYQRVHVRHKNRKAVFRARETRVTWSHSDAPELRFNYYIIELLMWLSAAHLGTQKASRRWKNSQQVFRSDDARSAQRVWRKALYTPAYMRVQSSELDMFQIFDKYVAAIESSVNLFFGRWLLQVDTSADLMAQDK